MHICSYPYSHIIWLTFQNAFDNYLFPKSKWTILVAILQKKNVFWIIKIYPGNYILLPFMSIIIYGIMKYQVWKNDFLKKISELDSDMTEIRAFEF